MSARVNHERAADEGQEEGQEVLIRRDVPAVPQKIRRVPTRLPEGPFEPNWDLPQKLPLRERIEAGLIRRRIKK